MIVSSLRQHQCHPLNFYYEFGYWTDKPFIIYHKNYYILNCTTAISTHYKNSCLAIFIYAIMNSTTDICLMKIYVLQLYMYIY